MARTQPTGKQIADASIQRDDLDSVTAGQAVIRKLIQGTGISLSSTGVDAGTGDVTINTSIPVGSSIWVDVGLGSNINALRERFDRPFKTITAAIAAAVAGDVIFLAPGTYTENAGFSLPNNVSMFGTGIDATILQSNLNSVDKAICTPGNSSIVADLTINGSTSGSVPLGCMATDQTFTNAIAYRVKLGSGSANIDCIYFHKAAAACSLKVYDSILLSGYDTVMIDAGTHDLEIWNSDLTCDGTIPAASTRALAAFAGTLRAFNCKLTTKNAQASAQNIPIYCNGGTVEAHNCRISRDTSGGIIYDLYREAGTLSVENISRDDGAPLRTFGAITYLHWYPIDKNILMSGGPMSEPMVDQTGEIMTIG